MTTLTHRYKAWLMLEAETPLSIGSGREGLTTDRLVARNAVGFPYIPGTGLAGALRAALEEADPTTKWESIWGDKTRKFEEKDNIKKDITRGSRIVVNSAHLLAADGILVLEGLPNVDDKVEYYQHLSSLPVRDHVRINHRGAAADKGKFDEQLCYKGVRFVCSLELLGTDKDADTWKGILDQVASPFFRLGGGTRKGFGKIRVVKQYCKNFDLLTPVDRADYLSADNSLQITESKWKKGHTGKTESEEYKYYVLTLTPTDFFFFGAGYGDDEADDIYKTEKIVDWNSGKAKILEEQILIPASSVKGALRHRLAFHYNVEAGHFIDKNADNSQVLINEKLRSLNNLTLVPEGISSDDAWWDETIQKIESQQLKTEEKGTRKESENDPTAQNPAVKALFGYAADQTANTDQKGQRGNVLFSDVFLKKENAQEKIFDHVRIDRFTGGASDGALFQEKTVDTKAEIILEMWVAAEALKDAAIYNAWHATLDDLCEGRLPLGGKTTKGHGYFSGTSNIDLKNRKEV